jgi:transposase-like protein
MARPPAPPRSARVLRERIAPASGERSGRRFSAEAIAAAVRELEAGVPAPVVCRRFGVSDRTLYRWRRLAAPALRRPA